MDVIQKIIMDLFKEDKFNKFYITTTLPYANSVPHVGHAIEFFQADAYARYFRRKLGADKTFLNIGAVREGERLLLGLCEDKNYRTIAASAMANGHVVNARTAMDVNLAKQLNILISDMDFPLERVLMDPTTGALGYGIEYGYSAMERLRLAALQGDNMTQLPMIVTPGFEAWKTKEAKVGEGVPDTWGEWEARSVNWETLTSITLLESGADILVLRHPQTIKNIKAAIEDLMAVPETN